MAENKKHTSVRLDPALIDLIDQYAAENYRSRNMAIEYLLREKMKEYKKQKAVRND